MLDKPSGITSNRALQQVKGMFCARKAGHGGTLDQPANGCLPIMFGSFTKLAEYMLDSHKVYECTIELGSTRTTGDATGDLIQEKPVPPIDAAGLEECLSKFRGEIMQRPPAYSALKYQGKRMHEYARAGIAIASVARPVTIKELILLERKDKHLIIRMTCSRGTYVRSLAEDIGEFFGCGAHVHTLRRTEMSTLPVKYLVTLKQIEDMPEDKRESLLLPDMQIKLAQTKIYVTLEQARQLGQGKQVSIPEYTTEPLVSIYIKDSTELDNSRLFGVGSVQDKILRTQKILMNVL